MRLLPAALALARLRPLGFVGLAGTLLLAPSFAYDNGQWNTVDPSIREWFKGLSNTRGDICCDTSDGHRVEDPDWRITSEGYSVLLNGQWQEAPPERIVPGNNRVGFAIAWEWPPGTLRCFMPGSTS